MAKRDFDRTVLMDAVNDGDFELVKALLTYVDIEETDNIGDTALSQAVYSENIEMLKILLSAGANPDPQTCKYWSPLTFASAFVMPEILIELLECGIDPNKPDPKNFTALYWAVKIKRSCGDTTIIEILKKYEPTFESPYNKSV